MLLVRPTLTPAFTVPIPRSSACSFVLLLVVWSRPRVHLCFDGRDWGRHCVHERDGRHNVRAGGAASTRTRWVRGRATSAILPVEWNIAGMNGAGPGDEHLPHARRAAGAAWPVVREARGAPPREGSGCAMGGGVRCLSRSVTPGSTELGIGCLDSYSSSRRRAVAAWPQVCSESLDGRVQHVQHGQRRRDLQMLPGEPDGHEQRGVPRCVFGFRRWTSRRVMRSRGPTTTRRTGW